MSDSIYNQTQVDSLVAAAVDKTVGEVTTELDNDIVKFRADLEQATETISAKDAEIETLKAEIASRDEALRLDTVGNDRAALVAAVTSFTDDELANRKARWAAMSEEDFTEILEDFKAINESASVSDSESEEVDEPETAVDLTRETASEDDEEPILNTFLSRI